MSELVAAVPEAVPLRVLAVTARYLPLIGGTEIHACETARRIAAAGNQVTVLTTNPSGRMASEEWIDGVHVLRVPAWPANRDYYCAPGIYPIITRGNWDIVHCQGVHTLIAPLAMLAACRAKIPYLVTFHTGGHSSWLRTRVRRAQWEVLRPLLARAERLLAVSNFEATFFQRTLRLPPERFVVIPNGVDRPGSSGPVAWAQPPLHGPLIVSIGRLERYKGHHRILAALPKIAESYPDVRLRIVGAGPYEAALRRQAWALGIAERVDIGAVPVDDPAALRAVLDSASLVTLLSDYEAHPIAPIEALASGCRLLVTDTSGLSELARYPGVRLIPAKSQTNEIAQAAVAHLRQPASRPDVELPTWAEAADAVLALYHESTRRSICAS